MGFISKKLKMKRKSKMLDREFALEIVEIMEEKLEDMKAKDVKSIRQETNKKSIDKVKKELICEIEDFIYSNKQRLINVP